MEWIETLELCFLRHNKKILLVDLHPLKETALIIMANSHSDHRLANLRLTENRPNPPKSNGLEMFRTSSSPSNSHGSCFFFYGFWLSPFIQYYPILSNVYPMFRSSSPRPIDYPRWETVQIRHGCGHKLWTRVREPVLSRTESAKKLPATWMELDGWPGEWGMVTPPEKKWLFVKLC